MAGRPYALNDRSSGKCYGGLAAWPIFAITIASALSWTAWASAAPRAGEPKEDQIRRGLETYFANLPGYQKGDLIKRSDIAKALAKVQQQRIAVRDANGIVKLGLADDSFLVREFSTPEGRRFMRKLAQHPGSIARVDRLSASPRGQTIVHDLVREKDGDRFVEYLGTTAGGQRTAAMLAQARGGADLNKPTGRIYTVDDLIAAIRNTAGQRGH